MNFYKYAISLVLAMILVVVSLSVVSATDTQMSIDLQAINENELNLNNDNINQNLNGKNINNNTNVSINESTKYTPSVENSDSNRVNSSSNNNIVNIYSFNISCENDFQVLSKYLNSCNKTYDCIYVNITKDITISSSNAWYENSKSLFIINGNHFTVKVSDPIEGF